MDFDPFELSLNIFKIFGLWRTESSSKLIIIYGISIHLFLIFTPTFLATVYLFTSDDLEEVMQLFNVYCTYWSMLLKTLNFGFKVKEIIELKKSLEELIKSGNFDENCEDFVKNVKLGYISYKAFIYLAWLNIGIAGVSSFVTHKLSYKIFKEDILDTELKYYCAAFYNVLYTSVCCSIEITLTSLPVIFMSYAVALLDDLSKRLTKIGDEVQGNDVGSIEKESVYYKDLIQCMEIHLKIKEFTRNIEKHFSAMILVQGLMSSIIFCTTIYILNQISPIDDTSAFLFSASYAIPMILEIFLPCFFGQLVRDAYAKLNTSLFGSSWYSRDRKHRQSVKVIMENMKKENKISAFGVFDVDLQTFTRVGNSAFSLYAVLKSFQ